MGFLSKLKPKSPKKALKDLTKKPLNPIEALKDPKKLLTTELGRNIGIDLFAKDKKGGGSLTDAIRKAIESAGANPFAQAMQNAPGDFVPGFGYVNRKDTNPFQAAFSQIPQGFFSSPAAQEMLAQAIGLRQPAPPRPPATPYVAPWMGVPPGPQVLPATLMGQVGGLGNGGGKMGILPFK